METLVLPTQQTEFVQYGFGNYYKTVVSLTWGKKSGWSEPRLIKRPKVRINPNINALHYGSALIEGMVGFYHEGKNVVFRADDHLVRLNNGAQELAMPEIPRDLFMSAFKMMFADSDVCADLVSGKTPSVYIRPNYINTTIGFNPEEVSHATLLITYAPLSNPADRKPMKVYVENKRIRAVVGGLSYLKRAGNYDSIVLPTQRAKSIGCQNVLWVDPNTGNVQELNTNNIFCFTNEGLFTPALDGTILPGITRKTIIELCSYFNVQVFETTMSIQNLLEVSQFDDVELFATGTASEVIGISEILYHDQPYFFKGSAFTKKISEWFRMARKGEILTDMLTVC